MICAWLFPGHLRPYSPFLQAQCSMVSPWLSSQDLHRESLPGHLHPVALQKRAGPLGRYHGSE